MHRISRRSFLSAAAALAVPQPLQAAPAKSRKAAFMKEAVNDIAVRELAPAPPPAQAQRRHPSPSARRDDEFRSLKFVCVPVPFADFDFYYTEGDLVWQPRPGQKLKEVRVPDGFCTDLTSVPQVFWSLLPRTGKYAYAAIIHDYLYWAQTTTRLEADDTLFAAMQDTEVGTFKLHTIYRAVRAFGNSAWQENVTAKAAGELRFLQQKPNRNELISWDEWRKNPMNFKS